MSDTPLSELLNPARADAEDGVCSAASFHSLAIPRSTAEQLLGLTASTQLFTADATMTRMLHIDIAPAAYRGAPDPGVAHVATREGDIVAVFDAWGSWGHGMDFAARARRAAAERWSEAPPRDIGRAAADVHEIAKSLGEPRDEFDDCAFDGVILLTSGASAWLAAAGSMCVVLASEAESKMLFRPRMLLDEYIAKRSLTPEEVASFPHKEVCFGPYLGGDTTPAPLVQSGPYEIGPGDAVVIAEHRLGRMLMNMRAEEWRVTAHELQRVAIAERWPACPVVVVTNLKAA